MTIPFVGGSYELARKKSDTQRTINMCPTPVESGAGKAKIFLQSIPGLSQFSDAPAPVPPPEPPHVCTGGPVWSARTIPLDSYSGLAYGVVDEVGRFVATGRGWSGTTPTNTAYSLDKGQTWLAGGLIPNVGNTTPTRLRFGNDMFLCLMGLAASPRSIDGGVSWTNGPGTTVDHSSMWFGGGVFAVTSAVDATVKSTPDGMAWTSHTTPAILAQCFWDAPRSRWLGLESAGLRVWTSSDLNTWTLRGNMPLAGTPIASDNIAQATFGPYSGTIVCGYNDGTDFTTYTDDGGVTWGSSAPLIGNQVESVLFGNGIFIVTKGFGGATEISSDGGRTYGPGNSLTTPKAVWLLAYNGLNSYTAVGVTFVDSTIANVGDC